MLANLLLFKSPYSDGMLLLEMMIYQSEFSERWPHGSWESLAISELAVVSHQPDTATTAFSRLFLAIYNLADRGMYAVVEPETYVKHQQRTFSVTQYICERKVQCHLCYSL